MRRRLMGETGLRVRKIAHEGVTAADAVFFDTASGAVSYYRLGEGWDELPETCVPIGVAVVPPSHNVYGSGACGVMSLREMDCGTPDTGSLSFAGIYWGSPSGDVPGLAGYGTVPYVGSAGTVGDSVMGTADYAYLPSDRFSRVANPYDTDTWYMFSDGDKYIPSPYNGDGTRNAAYYRTSAPSDASNAMSDFAGEDNTAAITAMATAQPDWKTAESIANDFSDGHYPAACCCWRYHTEGTAQGDWYLPSCGEMGYVMPNMGRIQKTVGMLADWFGESAAAPLSEGIYWTSTGYGGGRARYVDTATGGVNSNANDYARGVRAFIRTGGVAKNYGPVRISGGTAADIPASGGTSQASGYSYSQTWGWGDSTTGGGVITEGADVSVTSVSADSSGTLVRNRQKAGASTVTVSLNGHTAQLEVDVYQAENKVVGGTSVIHGHSYTEVGAAGGTSTRSSSSGVTFVYSSGASLTWDGSDPQGGTVAGTNTFSGSADGATVSSGGDVTWAGRGTSIGLQRGVSVTRTTRYGFTHDAEFGGHTVETESAVAVATCVQSANIVTAVTAGSNTFSYANIAAGATSATPSTGHSPLFTLSSGSTTASVPGSTYGSLATSCTYSLTSGQNGFTSVNSSTGVLAATSYGTTPGGARTSAAVTKTLRYTWTHTSAYGGGFVNSGNLTRTATCTQNANAATYGAVTVTAHGSASDIPASGGTVYGSGGSGSQTVSFTSGASRAGAVTCGGYSGVSADSLGTTVKSRTHVGNSTATLTGEGGKTAAVSVAVYQQANAATSITYGTPSVSLSYAVKNAAKGTVSPSCSYSQARTQNYTSGGTAALGALTSGGSLSFAETTAHGNASVASSTGVVTWDANQTASSRSVGITLTVTMNGKSGSKAATSTQSADSVSSTSWGDVAAGTITNQTVPASGGTKTATAGNGSQSYTQTWVSGRTTGGTNSVAPSVASISATGSHLGTTAKDQAVLKSQAVTWTGSGGKSASGTMYIYQQANAVTSTVYANPTVGFSYSTIAATTKTASPSLSVSQDYTQTWTSSSTQDHTISGITYYTKSFTESTNHSAATVNSSTGVVTWTENTSYTSSRSCKVTVTVTVNGKSSTATATSTQNAAQMSGNINVSNEGNSTIWYAFSKSSGYQGVSGKPTVYASISSFSSYTVSKSLSFLEGGYATSADIGDTIYVYWALGSSGAWQMNSTFTLTGSGDINVSIMGT